MSGELESDPLFLGLTRPPMLLGVSYTFAGINLLLCLMTFVITSNFIYLLVILPIVHGIAWLICLKEPRALELFIARSSKCSICRNRYYYGGVNSYDLY
ncbi:MAG: type IV secretion system protein VirB3 [Proteobacteria bacterium]|nr:type IV secretion system protein VirB3 [Pseudomonadota bacterium]NCA27734.1 type IV secretion system protein VirB3 [Pseudomonadota bacterium]